MLLIDANNLFFSEILFFHKKTGEQPSLQDTRNLLIRALMKTIRNHKGYGETVLAHDDRTYWRRSVFPHYKANRKKSRDDSTFDWGAFFKHFDTFRDEIKEVFPIKSLKVEGAEADDIIAILSLRYAQSEKVCVWSSDTDNLQLQFLNSNIKQYSPVKGKLITPKSEGYTLFEHIVKGDAGDGIPNILSPNNAFVDGIRQKSVFSAKLSEWEKYQHDPAKFCSEVELKRFNENKVLVDYKHIPPEISAKIVQANDECQVPKNKLFDYLIKHSMSDIIKDGGF